MYFWNRLYYGLFEYNRLMQLLDTRIVYKIFAFLLFLFRYKPNKARRNNWIFQMKIALSAFSDPRGGLIRNLAEKMMLIFITLLTWTLVNLISMSIDKKLFGTVDFITFSIITVAPSLTINYFFLWRKDRYLKYFKVFQKAPHRQNIIWMCTSMLLFILSIVMFFYSLDAM